MNDQSAAEMLSPEEQREKERAVAKDRKRRNEAARRRQSAWAGTIAGLLSLLLIVKIQLPQGVSWLDLPLLALTLAVTLTCGARALEGPESARRERRARLAANSKSGRASPSALLWMWLWCFLAIAAILLAARLLERFEEVAESAAAQTGRTQALPGQLAGTLTLTANGHQRKFKVTGGEFMQDRQRATAAQ